MQKETDFKTILLKNNIKILQNSEISLNLTEKSFFGTYGGSN